MEPEVPPVEPVVEPTDPTPPPPADPVAEAKAETEKWKALARKHEDAAKKAAPAVKRLAEIEESQKTEAERLTARADQAEKAAKEALTKVMRLEVAAEKGLPQVLVDRLRGDTPEEMAADADALIAALPTSKPRTPAMGPTGTPSLGLPEQIAAAEAAGDFKLSMALKSRQLSQLPKP